MKNKLAAELKRKKNLLDARNHPLSTFTKRDICKLFNLDPKYVSKMGLPNTHELMQKQFESMVVPMINFHKTRIELWAHKVLYGEPGDSKKNEGLLGMSPIQAARSVVNEAQAATKKTSRTQKRRSQTIMKGKQ